MLNQEEMNTWLALHILKIEFVLKIFPRRKLKDEIASLENLTKYKEKIMYIIYLCVQKTEEE